MTLKNSKRRFFICASLVLAISLSWTWFSTYHAKVIHTEPSQFGPIVVYERAGLRCMAFGSVNNGDQTCIRKQHPRQLVFRYGKLMMSALFVQPSPKSVLIIGLGGGSLPTVLHQILPDATIDSVEIDPGIARVAQRHFAYQPGPRQRLFIDDGRAFVEQAHREGRKYDMVMLDAFDSTYIPPQLMTAEFLEHVRGVLNPGGLIITNTFTTSKLNEQESATYKAVFGPFYNMQTGEVGNRIILASTSPLPDEATLTANAKRLSTTFQGLDINTRQTLQRFVKMDVVYNPEDVLHDPDETVR